VPEGKHTIEVESVSGMGSTRYVFLDLIVCALKQRSILKNGVFWDVTPSGSYKSHMA
jgi:hypothetical protein